MACKSGGFTGRSVTVYPIGSVCRPWDLPPASQFYADGECSVPPDRPSIVGVWPSSPPPQKKQPTYSAGGQFASGPVITTQWVCQCVRPSFHAFLFRLTRASQTPTHIWVCRNIVEPFDVPTGMHAQPRDFCCRCIRTDSVFLLSFE